MKRMGSQSGQTLIEVVLAAGLMVMVLTTLVAGLSIGVRNNRVAKDQAAAKDYVRETLEWMRNTRDAAGWDTFYAISKPGKYCFGTLPVDYKAFANLNPISSTGTCSTTIGSTPYIRELVIEKPGPNMLTGTATVKWAEGTKTLSASSISTLYQWK